MGKGEIHTLTKFLCFCYLHHKAIIMIRFTAFILSIVICLSASTQDCGSYLVLKKNNIIEYSIVGVDRSGTWTVKDVKSDSNSCRATISARYPFIGKKYREYEFDVLFEDNVLKLSISGMLGGSIVPEKKKKSDGDDVQEDIFIEYPSTMEVGQTFDNVVGDLNMRNLIGKGSSKVRISIINREVVGKETVSTPTGKYECFKITFDMGVKDVNISTLDHKSHYTEWFAPGVGVVKTMATGGVLSSETLVSVLSSVKSN